jgi:cbb3-type cytochrome oxidase subunit 3
VKLAEIMSAAQLQVFAEIGLGLFLAIFCGVLAYTFARKNRTTFERARSAPLREAERSTRESPTHE